MMAPGTSSMLRARRRDVNVKPNRRLDRKSSRGMLYENEELRLRTININAEVERGQNDIKKLRRENEQLRREIWGLREEYDRLEGLLGKAKRRGQLGNTSQDEDSDNEDGYEDEDGEYDEEEEDDDEDASPCENSADLDNAENQQKASSSSIRTPGPSRRNSLRVEFDGLSIVDEETETVSNDVTPVEQCAEEGASATNASRQGAVFFGGVKPQDGEACAPISNRDECFRQRHEQQFFGKIKLPNGKEGVFMSDAVLPNSNISNGLPIYGANNLKGNSYDFGPVVGFGPNDYHILNENVWSDIPTLLPGTAQNVIPSGTAMFPTSQSHYNYTFTPVDSTMLPTGASTQDNNYAFERPNNFPGIPDADAVLPNVATGREPRTEHVYLEGGRNTIMHDSGVNDDAYFGMGENMATTTTGDEIIPDYYHKRGGPDLFISGAYPVTRSPGVFPVGGNLDQLLKQMSSNENESVPTVEVTEATCSDTTLTKSESNVKEVPQKDAVGHVQEVIDALENQIDSKLNDAVRGVRVVNGNCYVCLTKEDNAGALLETGLTLRGAKINLENASRDSVIVALSGVPHDVSDSSVTRIVANYGAVIGDVERRMYKGVDTGERFVRLKPADADIKNVPSTINLAGSKATLRILKPDEVEELGCVCVPKSMGVAGATEDKTKDASKKQTQYGENPSKSLDSSFSADRYRSQLNVRLKQPNLKTNRSLDNIFDSTSDRTQHNTSLPIIDACDTIPAKLAPAKMPSETRLSETRYKKPCEGTVNFDGLESALPPKLPSLLQSETISALSASGQEAKSKETATREGRKLTQEQELDLLLQENRILKTFVVREPQSSPEVAINNTPNIFSKLPTRKSKCQNAQILSTTDESTDSAELHLKASPQLQSNPFVGNFRTASPNNAVFPGYFRRPITPAQINPFISTTPNPNHGIVYEDITLRGERSSVQCPPHFPIYQGDLSPLDHQRQLLLSQGTSNSRACSPYSHINASYPHSNQPPNIAFVSNEAVYIPNSAGTSFPGTSSLPTTIALFSSNPSAASATAGLPQGSHVHPSAGYFHNPPIPSTAALMPPSNTIMPGNTGYFHPNATNFAAPSTTYVPGSVAIVVPPSMSIPGSAEHFQMPPDLPTNTHPGHLSTAQSANISMPKASSPNTSTFPPSQQNSSQIPPEPPSHHEGNKQRQEHTDVTENTLEVPRTQSTSVPSSPVPKQIAQTKAPRKSSIISRQQSKSSGDEGPNLSPPAVHKVTAPASPGAARRKTSRKVSCTNSIASHHNVDNSINESSTGSAGGPNATSSPNTKHRSSVMYHRKTSTGAAGGADASGGVHANVIDVSRSSSSGAGKRRDSVFVPNGSSAPSGGILTRSLSLELSHRYPGGSSTNVAGGHCAGAETTTTTCSERERTNSASSRTSSAAGGLGTSRLRKQSVCSNRGGSGSDVGKVPWCGCWGNGCI